MSGKEAGFLGKVLEETAQANARGDVMGFDAAQLREIQGRIAAQYKV